MLTEKLTQNYGKDEGGEVEVELVFFFLPTFCHQNLFSCFLFCFVLYFYLFQLEKLATLFNFMI